LVDQVGRDAAKKMVRFRLGHYEELEKVVGALGTRGEASEMRRVESVTGILGMQAWESVRAGLHRFETECEEWRGLWRVGDGVEAEVSKLDDECGWVD
jgi:hypothetical protein